MCTVLFVCKCVLYCLCVNVYCTVVCKCVSYYCHRVSTQLQLTDISFHIKERDTAQDLTISWGKKISSTHASFGCLLSHIMVTSVRKARGPSYAHLKETGRNSRLRVSNFPPRERSAKSRTYVGKGNLPFIDTNFSSRRYKTNIKTRSQKLNDCIARHTEQLSRMWEVREKFDYFSHRLYTEILGTYFQHPRG